MMRIGATTRLGLSPFTFLRACRPWRVFAFFYLAKLAECFARSLLTKPELVEENSTRGSLSPFFRTAVTKLTNPGKKRKA